MLVSTVIPARDAEAYLGEALESVLRQTLPVDEVIVVDDGSTDATADIAGGFGDPVRCIRQEPSGVGAALNRGVEQARGTILGFLDADDLWEADKNEIQVRALTQPGGPDMVFGHVSHFHSPELSAADRDRLVLPAGLAPGFLRGAMLVRREGFERVGGFATHWSTGEFIDWYARASDAGLRGDVLPDVVVRRRLHRRNIGVRIPAADGDFIQVLKAVLDRRRVDAQGEPDR